MRSTHVLDVRGSLCHNVTLTLHNLTESHADKQTSTVNPLLSDMEESKHAEERKQEGNGSNHQRGKEERSEQESGMRRPRPG